MPDSSAPSADASTVKHEGMPITTLLTLRKPASLAMPLGLSTSDDTTGSPLRMSTSSPPMATVAQGILPWRLRRLSIARSWTSSSVTSLAASASRAR